MVGEQGKFRVDVKKIFPVIRAVRHLNRSLPEVVQPPSSEVVKISVSKALRNPTSSHCLQENKLDSTHHHYYPVIAMALLILVTPIYESI